MHIISANGLEFIKAEEGFQPVPKDDNGHLMWGYGHDRLGVEPTPASISEADAEALLIRDISERFGPAVNSLADWANQNQFDALVSFCYNLGKLSLATMLHHGEAQVPVQMAAWCYEHVNGHVVRSEALYGRREREIELFNAQVK